MFFNQSISCPEAKSIIEAGGQLIDVRSPMEHAQFTIPGSKNIPLSDIGSAELHLDKSKPVIVYCQSGARSGHAQMVLTSMGFPEVHNLGSIQSYFSC